MLKQESSINTNLTFKIYNSIQECSPQLKFPLPLLLQPQYLQSLQHGVIKGLQTFCALVYDNAHAIGLVYFQAINLAAEELGSTINLEPYGKFLNLVSDKLNRLLFCNAPGKANWLLVCGNMNVSGETAFAVLPNYKTQLVNLLPAIITAVTNQLKKSGKLSAVIVKDFSFDNDHPIKPTLEKEKFIRFVMDPIMIMDSMTSFTSFDTYLQAMSSKYRLRTNNAIKKIASLTQKNFNVDDIINHSLIINQLYFAVQHRSPVRVLKPDVNSFIELKKNMGNQFIFKVFYLNDKIIAFMTGFYNTTHFEAHHIGMDYHYNKEYSLYQNLLYSFIREAINNRVQTLSFGRTALEIKSTVGAHPVEHAAYLRLNNSLLNKLIKPFMPTTSPDKYILRDPFKS